LMGSEGSVPPSDGIPLVDVYGGPEYGLGAKSAWGQRRFWFLAVLAW
jgi:hypothetical protein